MDREAEGRPGPATAGIAGGAPASEVLLLKAINSSAAYVNAATITFLVTATYVLVTAISTTDRDLLLERSLVLPLVQVGVPIVGFYFFAPILLALVHVNVLVQRYLLSRRFGALRGAEELPARLGNQLVASVALAVLERPARPRGVRYLLLFLYLAGLLVFPACILLYMQAQFLPYHSRLVTFDHRLCLVADLFVAGYCGFLSEGHRGSWHELWAERGRWTRGLKWGFGAFVAAAAAALVFSFAVAVIPGGLLERLVGIEAWSGRLHRDLDVAGEILVEREPEPRALEEAGEDPDAVSQAWLRSSRGIDLSGRRLERADFSRAFLSNSNFSRAHLEGAKFVGTHLEGASFDPDDPRGPGGRRRLGTALRPAGSENAALRRTRTSLEGVDFRGARLLEADLSGADLAGARFDGADLRRSRMVASNLAGSGLEGARLRWADLSRADLNGAQLQNADLLGAILVRSRLIGASPIGAHLELADLSEAHLESVDLVDARLDGARLEGAVLRGGDLRGAWLAGATGVWASMVDLRQAHLAGADLCSTVSRGEPGPRDSDFRGVELSEPPPALWQGLEKTLRTDPLAEPRRAALLRRLAEARRRELCIPSEGIEFRRLLYDRVGRPAPLGSWGPPKLSEEVVYSGIVDWLVGEACHDPPLAKALERRARHQVVPANRVEERLLARAMRARAADGDGCPNGARWEELSEGR